MVYGSSLKIFLLLFPRVLLCSKKRGKKVGRGGSNVLYRCLAAFLLLLVYTYIWVYLSISVDGDLWVIIVPCHPFSCFVLTLVIILACRLDDYVSTPYSVVGPVGRSSRWFLIS